MSRTIELPALRDRIHVFADRADGGRALAALVDEGELVLAIPAGGVPVAIAVADRLRLPLDVAVVSKITPSWNSEVGYGAVAFDGTTRLDARRAPWFGLSDEEIASDTRRTREKVARRVASLRRHRPGLDVAGRSVVLVDDGLASGFTMEVAIDAVRGAGARRVVAAAPTGHVDAVARLAERADVVVCANLRSGRSFAVADAYRDWRDLADDEIERALLRSMSG
jgi:predicted phosphoribosyltransferase